MTFDISRTLYRLILLNSQSLDEININEYISEYKQIASIEDPIFWLSCGAFICFMSGLIFADIMKSKLREWSTNQISPLPLGNPRTISSWFSFFSGLTITFISALTIFNFSSANSFLFSTIVSILFGISMWKAIKDLLVQVKAGTIKEIDNFF